ncbi:hypothetical protein AB838_18765 [Rhodobacteraceae bacterium (ex Bugula neritina AB1)]|nr:hypothetical protein AB838_18765 [Rhodobacteraceae bacterium (ex Bugula neritina AB1)]
MAPAGRWHAGTASVSLSGDRVQTASAEVGPGLSAGGAGVGPQADTDALGRDFWHFDGSAYFDVGPGLTFSSRQMAVFAVVRILGGNTPVFGIGNRTGYGAGSTHTNTGGASLDTSTSGQVAPFVRAYSRSARSDSAQKHNVIGGQQLQVMGAVTRSSGNGGSRLYLNGEIAAVSHPSINATNVEGAEIGRRVDAPGTSGKWAKMDLYELVVYDQILSDAEGAAIAAALTQHWAIPDVTDQLVMEGDSIMAGAGSSPANNAARVLSAPGAGQVPGAMRVSMAAISGNRIADLTARRDLTHGWASQLLPGRNVMAFEIGRNDFTKVPLMDFYNDVVAYLNTPTTGVLQRGWEVRVMLNIASGSAFQSDIETYRALLRNPQFLSDLDAGPGQSFDGRVRLIETDLITQGAAGTLFASTADASDTGYYQGDATHPSNPGIIARATGADTPQYGIADGLI